MAYQADSGLEPVSATFGIAVASGDLWYVPSGVTVTYSSIDMTYAVSAGAVVLNGIYVPVLAQTGITGLASDPSNPRWAWLAINSSGVGTVILGTAAANPIIPAWDPTKVLIGLCQLAPAQTIASSSPIQLDKRIPGAFQYQQTASDFIKNNNDTMADVTGLSFFVDANEKWVWEVQAEVAFPITPGVQITYSYPSGATINGGAEVFSPMDVAAESESNFVSPLLFAALAADGIQMHCHGHIQNSTTPGIVQLRMAQITPTASNTIIYNHSWIHARRVG